MKKILLCFLITLFSMSLKAQTYLVVNPLESWQKTYSFHLSDVRNLSFHDGKLNVELASAETTAIPLSEISEVKSDSRNGIETMKPALPTALVYDPKAVCLAVNGVSGNTALSVYSTDGRLCLYRPVYDGSAIDVAGLPRGVYVVVVDNSSFKFAK